MSCTPEFQGTAQGYYFGLLYIPFCVGKDKMISLTFLNDEKNLTELIGKQTVRMASILAEAKFNTSTPRYAEAFTKSFLHALPIGLINGTAHAVESQNQNLASSKRSEEIMEKSIKEVKPTFVDGIEIGDIISASSFHIAVQFIQRKSVACSGCQYTHFCHCFSMTLVSDIATIFGDENFHLSTCCCTICGSFDLHTGYRTDYKCATCQTKSELKERRDLVNLRKKKIQPVPEAVCLSCWKPLTTCGPKLWLCSQSCERRIFQLKIEIKS